MKRLLLTLAAGAFGSVMVPPIVHAPIAHAQSWQDMNSDEHEIHRDNAGIRHDREEQREDVENGNLGAAAREQLEIQQRKADRNATRNDLNNDMSNRYYGDSDGSGYHHDDDDD